MANTMRFTQAQSETLNLPIQLHGDQIQIFCSRVAHIVDLRGINLKEYARMIATHINRHLIGSPVKFYRSGNQARRIGGEKQVYQQLAAAVVPDLLS